MSESLPPGWVAVQLRDVVDVLDNRRVPINEAERTRRLAGSSDRYPYYGATGQVGEIDDYILEGQSILLGEDGAPFLDARRNKAYVVDGRYWVNNHAHILRAKEGFSNRFLCHQLNLIDYHPYVSGTTRLKLTKGAMSEMRLLVAPSREQDLIASKIDELFSRIDEGERALERAQKLVERYRQSVLKAAVTGELTRDWRKKNKGQLESGEAMLARILKVRREAWEKAELDKMKAKGITPANAKWREKYEEPSPPDAAGLPELPQGWVWVSVDQLAYDVTYGSSAKCGDDSIGVPVLRMGNINAGAIDTTFLKYLPADHGEFPNLLLKSGDLLFNRTNSAELVGKSAVFRIADGHWSFASYLIRVRVAAIEAEWLAHYINSVFGRAWISNVKNQQVGQANVNGSKLKALAVPVPPQQELAQILDAVAREFSRADATTMANNAESQRSMTLRHTILRGAFSGSLVDQDPTDEPAAALLKRISAERGAAPAKLTRGIKSKVQEAV